MNRGDSIATILPMQDAHHWQECNSPLIPRRTIEGRWTYGLGKLWRRRRPDGKWEYSRDQQTFDEWSKEQW